MTLSDTSETESSLRETLTDLQESMQLFLFDHHERKQAGGSVSDEHDAVGYIPTQAGVSLRRKV